MLLDVSHKKVGDVGHKLQQIRIQHIFGWKFVGDTCDLCQNQTLPTPNSGKHWINFGMFAICQTWKTYFLTTMSKSINININNNNPKPVSPMSCWFHSCLFVFPVPTWLNELAIQGVDQGGHFVVSNHLTQADLQIPCNGSAGNKRQYWM